MGICADVILLTEKESEKHLFVSTLSVINKIQINEIFPDIDIIYVDKVFIKDVIKK